MSEEFRRLFGVPPSGTAEAPGRVNLIGEHTDYNGGFVLPAAIPRKTTVEWASRSDGIIRVATAAHDQKPPVIEYRTGEEKKAGQWTDYVQGITWVLSKSGYPAPGLNAFIRSTVPVAAGLSSSAALEISFLRAARAAWGLKLEELQLAQLAHEAENEFVGAPVGILDQMACTFADEQNALFLDTRTLAFDRIPIPEGVRLSVVDSGIQHDTRAGDYRTRRAECEEAARLLGVRELRDVSTADLPRINRLPEPFNRRARHVVTENERVLQAVDAMRSGDVVELGRLFCDSHASMRDDFCVSLPEIDRIVELARRQPAVLGTRLTGGGFGGAVVLLVRPGSEAAVREVLDEYVRETGQPGKTLV